MHETLSQLNAEYAALLLGLDAAETQSRPAERPDAWTVQQIVEHLMLSYESTAKIMEVRLAKGTPTKARASARHLAVQFTIASLGVFPNGHKAPEIVQPGTSKMIKDGDALAAVFAASLYAMDDRLGAVERALGTGRCVTHALLGPMSIAQWRRFHRTHGRHHLKQVRRILEGASKLPLGHG